MENENIEQRLAILFAKEDNDLQGEDKVINDNLQDPYLSVNEDLTTDTSATTDYEDSSIGQRGSVKTATQVDQQNQSDDDAGLVSSDQESSSVVNDGKATNFNEEGIFKNERTKDDVEHQYNFDD